VKNITNNSKQDPSNPTTRVLVLFSNPPDQATIRLDKEDKALGQLEKDFDGMVSIERLHASDIDSAADLIANGDYNIIHFSGHGDPSGIYLDKADLDSKDGERVSANRLLNLLMLSERPPTLVLLLCCYSKEYIDILCDCAPFVISCENNVSDEACIVFVKGFYQSYFRADSVQRSFDQAKKLLQIKALSADSFHLSRRHLIRSGDSVVVECRPNPEKDPFLVNLDSVLPQMTSLGLSEEEFCFLFAKKLKIHYWIFGVPRDRAVIPIGQQLFGVFEWTNAKDIVHCRRLFRLQSDVPPEQWELWFSLLISYNDLASSDYRGATSPADPGNKYLLSRACHLFTHQIDRYLKPARVKVKSLELGHVVPNMEAAIVSCERASDMLELDQYPQVVQALEMCLTNLHEVVDGIQPPEE